MKRWRRIIFLVAAIVTLGLGFLILRGPGPTDGPRVVLRVPHGASFQMVVDTFEARGLVGATEFFKLYARFKGADRGVKAGPYSFAPGTRWSQLLEDITRGRVQTESLTIPEGFRLTQMAPRIASITEVPEESVLAYITTDSADVAWSVPGPGLEGYLFPDTYYVARGAALEPVILAMVERYKEFWTPERIARLEVLELTEGELVTLASIIQSEARVVEEMPTIASVYHNRLDRGQLLQADPTVLYALGGYRARLLYAAMDSVADHPYNTYTQSGLPPGPIGAPGEEALMAALYPADTEFLYFVAEVEGNHIFSRTLAEHNLAVARVRPEWAQYRREQASRHP